MSEKNKTIVGLSISDFSAEIVWAEKVEDLIKAKSHNQIFLPNGIVKNGRIIKPKILAGLFQDLFENAKPLSIPRNVNVFFALSQDSVFTHVFAFFENKKNDLHEIIKSEADKAIPIKKDEITIVYKKIRVNEKKQKVILFAAKQKIISEWNIFFKRNNIFIQRFEIEALAFFRALPLDNFQNPICLLDIGLNTINISFFSNSGFLYNRQSQYGGKYISEKLARSLKMDFDQAEELKKNISLIYENKDNEIAREILNKIFVHIVEEIKSGLVQFSQNYPAHGEVSKIFLLGGGSNTKGIVDFFKQNFSKSEIIPVNRIFYQSDLSIEYLTAFGLVNIGLSESLQKSDLAFLPHSSRMLFKVNLKYFSLIILFVFVVYFFNFSHKTIFLNAPNLEQEVKFKQEEIMEGATESESAGNDFLLKGALVQEIEKNEISKPIVRINDFGSSLNVRQGAGTDYDIIGKVFSGQEFDFVQEKSGWYEIIFNEIVNGWVFSEYADKVE